MSSDKTRGIERDGRRIHGERLVEEEPEKDMVIGCGVGKLTFGCSGK
jgi:hypothetical protein